jgi:CRISPR/Cas system-associated exonuclease Cas4 (RecB family)
VSDGPSYRSHSQLTTYMECPTKYKLKYLEGVKEKPSIWLPGGTAFHSATEHYDRGDVGRTGIAAAFVEEFDKEVAVMEEASGLARDEFRAAGRVSKANPLKENWTWWRDAGQSMALEYVDWRENNTHLEIMEIDGRDMIEAEFLPILEGVAVKMYLDRLFVDTNTGSAIIVDLKTGATTPPDLQLGVYRVGVQKLLGLTVDYGAFYKARQAGLGVPIEITRWTEAVVGQLFAELDYAIKQEMFLPSITRDCGSCGVRPFCPYMGDQA